MSGVSGVPAAHSAPDASGAHSAHSAPDASGVPAAHSARDDPALFRLAQSGDPDAADALTRRHLPLVRMCARRVSRDGRLAEELPQQGCVGLLTAIRRFDPARGVRFSSYAVPFVLGEMRKLLRGRADAACGWRDAARLSRARAAGERLARALHREPTLPEIAESLRMDAAELVFLLEGMRPARSLSAPLNGDADGVPLCDLLADPVGERWLERLDLRDAVERLPALQRQVLSLRFGAQRTQCETARSLGLTQTRVSREEARARIALRAMLMDGGGGAGG